MNRREFVKSAELAAAAVGFGGGARGAGQSFASATTPEAIKAVLLHLGRNMWCEDVLRDAYEIFGHPRFIHIGCDAETAQHQDGSGVERLRVEPSRVHAAVSQEHRPFQLVLRRVLRRFRSGHEQDGRP
jgi:hypothetical protein